MSASAMMLRAELPVQRHKTLYGSAIRPHEARSRGTTTSAAICRVGESNHRNRNVAANAPENCAAMKPTASIGRIPENVFVSDRAIVTAGFAKDVDAVNQYAPAMYKPT